MSKKLDDYYAEVHRLELFWYKQYSKRPYVIGCSLWPHFKSILKEIEDRHGITSLTREVYSIKGYLAELERLKGVSPKVLDPDTMDAKACVDAISFTAAREADCDARHFGGISSPAEIETRPQLWYYIKSVAIPVVWQLQNIPLYEPKKILSEVHACMHRLAISWANEPPYDAMSSADAIDLLNIYANRLEAEDDELTVQLARSSDGSTAENVGTTLAKEGARAAFKEVVRHVVKQVLSVLVTLGLSL